MILGNTFLPSSGYPPFDWLIYLAATAAAAGTLYRFIFRPISRGLTNIEDFGPVLKEIAKQFKNDSGSTLKDQLDRIEKRLAANEKAFQELRRSVVMLERRIVPAKRAERRERDLLEVEAALMEPHLVPEES